MCPSTIDAGKCQTSSLGSLLWNATPAPDSHRLTPLLLWWFCFYATFSFPSWITALSRWGGSHTSVKLWAIAMDRSQWRVLTKCGPLEKKMATYSTTLAWRTSWTGWKGKKAWCQKIHVWFNGCEFEQTLGDSGGQRSLACYSLWGHWESDNTQWLRSNNLCSYLKLLPHRNVLWHPLCVESKKKWSKWNYLQNRNRLTDLGDELMVAGGRGKVGITDKEFGMDSAIFKTDNQEGPTV